MWIEYYYPFPENHYLRGSYVQISLPENMINHHLNADRVFYKIFSIQGQRHDYDQFLGHASGFNLSRFILLRVSLSGHLIA